PTRIAHPFLHYQDLARTGRRRRRSLHLAWAYYPRAGGRAALSERPGRDHSLYPALNRGDGRAGHASRSRGRMAAAMEGAATRPGLDPARDGPTGLLALLARLDGLLVYVLSAGQGPVLLPEAEDAFRGLHVGPDEVARLLAAPPGQPLLPPTAPQA